MTTVGEALRAAAERLAATSDTARLDAELLMAHALGFGGALTSGKALASAPLRRLFDLHDDEQALCFVNIGTVAKPKRARARPQAAQYVSVLQP